MPDTHLFRAHVGDHTFDIRLADGQLLIDDEPADYSWTRLNSHTYSLLVDGQSLEVVVVPEDGERVRVTVAGQDREVLVKDARALLLERFGLKADAGTAVRTVRAPMPGLVLKVLVEPGQAVKEGEGLLVLEAMKMENELRALADGVVKALHVAPGEAVGKNALLLEFEA